MTEFSADPKSGPSSTGKPEPSTVATPEGDNEFAPDQPLKPVIEKDDVLQKSLGNAPQSYKKDHD